MRHVVDFEKVKSQKIIFHVRDEGFHKWKDHEGGEGDAVYGLKRDVEDWLEGKVLDIVFTDEEAL